MLTTQASFARDAVKIAFARGVALFVVAFGATCIEVATAGASTVVNGDTTVREIEIIEGGNERRTKRLKPTEKLAKVCSEGCLVKIVGEADSTYVLEGREHVTIEGGRLFWDGLLDDKGELAREQLQLRPGARLPLGRN